MRPLALARGPSWPGGGGRRHPYPRPELNRDPTSFAFGTKQASGTHVSIAPGRRAEKRSFLKDEPRPQQASAQPVRLSGPVGLGRLPRPRPCPSHRADSPGDGRLSRRRQARSQRPGVARRPRLVSQTLARPVFRYLPLSFHPFLPTESSRPPPLPPPAPHQTRPRCWRLGSRRAGGLEDCPALSFPRAGFRAFPAPRGVKSLQPLQILLRPLDGPTDS